MFGNVTGGVHRTADYDGLTLMSLGPRHRQGVRLGGRHLQHQRAADPWPQPQRGFAGRGADGDRDRGRPVHPAVGAVVPAGVPGREARRQARPAEVLDQEFMISQGASLFINAAMGWPALPSADQYSGGPAYPVSSLGGPAAGAAERRRHGARGRVRRQPDRRPIRRRQPGTGRRAIRHRVQHRHRRAVHRRDPVCAEPGALGGAPPAGAPPLGLPGTYKLGFWYDSGPFYDQHFDHTGPVARQPGQRWPGEGALGRLQPLWRDGSDGLAARSAGRPRGRRVCAADGRAGRPQPGRFRREWRRHDAGGRCRAATTIRSAWASASARISSAASAFDKDTAFFAGRSGPVRSSETFIELTYSAQLAPCGSACSRISNMCSRPAAVS